ncbi:MAG TPA: hypothetical protein VF493_10735 [Terriglobales bacterium]
MKLEKRVQIVLPVRVHKKGVGASLWDTACTYDISAGGARLTGMRAHYDVNEIVTLERGKYRGHCRVAWVGCEGTPLQRQMGVQLLHPDKQIWDVDLAALQEQYEPIWNPADQPSEDQRETSFVPGVAQARIFVGSEVFQGELIQLSMRDCTVQLAKDVRVRGSSTQALITGKGFDLRLRGTLRGAASTYVIVDLEEIRRGDRRVLDYLLNLRQEQPKAEPALVGH